MRFNNEDLEALGHCVDASVNELAQVRAHLRNRLNRDLLIILRNHFCALFVLQAPSNPGSLNDSVEREGDNVVDKDDGLEDAEHPVPDESHLAASDRLLTFLAYRCSIHRRVGSSHWRGSMGSQQRGRESRLLSSYNFANLLRRLLSSSPSPSHTLLKSSSGSSYRLEQRHATYSVLVQQVPVATPT